MTGYEQAILLGIGSWNGDRYAVRSINKWYPECVSHILGGKVYVLSDGGHGKPQYACKQLYTKAFNPPTTDDIDDWKGFVRGWIELHGRIQPSTRRRRTDGSIYYVPSLRIWGKEEILSALQCNVPAKRKKLQRLIRSVDGKYTGVTFELRYQAPMEIFDILKFADDIPQGNPDIWDEIWNRYYSFKI